jgi:hypothetical protein
MTLDMFFEEDFKPWSESHVAGNRKQWGKLTKQHALYNYNRDWYKRVLSEAGNKHLLYAAGLEIPHYSKWAEVEAVKRGLI